MGPTLDPASVITQPAQSPLLFPLPATTTPAVDVLPSFSNAIPSPSSVGYISPQIAQERTRIAREIHDGVGQSLAYVKLKTHLLRNALDEDMAWLEEELEDLETLLGNAIAELRRCVCGLRPVYLESGGLLSALIRLVDEFNRLKQHRVQLDWVGPNDIPQPLEDAFFRVAQEALNNATKYAQAGSMVVGVENLTSQIRLIIQDDGIGCSAQDRAGQQGFGLVQMRERIEALGGTLEIESRPTGTRLVTAFFKHGRAPWR